MALTFEHSHSQDKGNNHYSQEQQKQEQEQPPPRIYFVTEAVNSPYTKQGYSSAFNDFLKTTVKNQDLRVLLDYKPNVIESKIISHIEKLKERNLSRSTINMYCAAIFHFFEINDISINTRKIKRFIPKDESDFYLTDRPRQ